MPTPMTNGPAARAPAEAEASPMRVMPVLNPNHAHTVLAEVLERVISRDGRRYLIGHMGPTKILIVSTGVISRGQPVWQVILEEGFYAERNGTAMARGLED
jgi:hypothetical protein